MIFHKTTCLLALYATLLHSAVAAKSSSSSCSSSTASVGSSSDASASTVAANINAAHNVNGNVNGNGNNNGNNNGASSASSASSANSASSASSANSASSASSASNASSANDNQAASLTLAANAVQTGSQSNGLADAEAGQSASATDNANFINFCAGKTLTNGLQVAGGSCNGIVMGDIPSSGNMISTIITNPGPGSTIPANQDFDVNVQIANLVAGSFTNPDSTYYAAPQALQGGKVVGHTHVTIQSLGNDIATSTPPDAGTFAFFKGINDAGNGNGGLSATVTGGLPAGVYRVCTMTSASNHQPVTMPLAQRGSQDDCTKFFVTNGGGNTNANANTATTAATAAATTVSSGNSNSNSTASGNQAGRGGKNGGRGKRFVLREFVA